MMKWDKTTICKCPCCLQEQDTCAHVLHCCHHGRVETIHGTLNLIKDRLEEAETEPELQEVLMEYACGRGGLSMEEVCCGRGKGFARLGRDQDEIGWRWFMEAMVCKQAREMQTLHRFRAGTSTPPDQWASGLILKLMETTHGQWLYRNVQIHTNVSGTEATLRKEAIQKEIEEQLETGGEGLLEEDQLMMEVNLGNMEKT
jgi:hypothetical protein